MVLPILSCILLLRLKLRLEEPDIKERIEALYEKIDTSRSASSVFIVLFFLRRFVYALSMVTLQSYQSLQISLLLLQSVLMLLYLLSVRPFNHGYLTNLEIFNEICVLACAYHLIAYTNFQPDPAIGYEAGTSMISITLFVAIVNFCAMLYQTGTNLKLACRKLQRRYC